MKLRPSAERLAINAIVEVLAVSAAITQAEETLIEAATSSGCKHAVSFAGLLGDDVDHRVDRVRSPDGSSGSTNHFDTLNILKQRILDFPVHSGKQGSVNTAPVYEDQH